MRVALVSPYSWTYPGGVTRHIEALAAELDRAGHDVKVFAPFDPDRRRTALLHRGARPQVRDVPEWLVPLGRDDRLAVQRRRVELSPGTPSGVATLRRELRAGGFDVVHIHEPVAPVDRLGRADERRRATCGHVPLLLGVGPAAQGRGAARRAPQAQPPQRPRSPCPRPPPGPGRRFYGGRYRVIPNGVVAARRRRAGAARRGARASRCGSRSSARPSSARACPCCCAPSRRCAARSRPS